MSQDKTQDPTQDQNDLHDGAIDPSRRKFLNTAALVGLTGAGLSVGLSACKQEQARAFRPGHAGQRNPGQGGRDSPKPGQLDDLLRLVERRPHRRFPCAGHALRPRAAPRALFRARCPGGLGHHQRVQEGHGHQARRQPAVHRGRHPSHPCLLQGRQLRRPLRLDQRQDQQPHRPHPPRHFVCDKITKLPNVQGFHGIFPDKRDRSTRPSTTPPACSAAASSISRCPITADVNEPEKYRAMFTCVDAETMEVRWQVLIDGNCDLCRHLLRWQAGRLQPVQHRERRALRGHDVGRTRRLHLLQHRPHRAGGEGRSLHDLGIRACRWSTARVRRTPIRNRADRHRVRAEEPPRRERQPRWQVLHLRRQAVAHRNRDRTAEGARLVRRQARRHRRSHRRRGRTRPGAAAHGLRRPWQRLHHPVPGQPGGQVERGCAIKFHNGDNTAQYVRRPPRRALPARPHQRLAVGDHVRRRQVAGGGLQVLQGPLPAGRPAARRERADGRHLRRQDGAGGRAPGASRTARLHHLQARPDQPEEDLLPDEFPLAIMDPKNVGVYARRQQGHGEDGVHRTGHSSRASSR
jgi:hypothetical protein